MDFKVCTSEADIKALAKLIKKVGRCAVDTETTGLHGTRDRIIILPITCDSKHFVIPVRMLTIPNASMKHIRKWIGPTLRDNKIIKDLFNTKFDAGMLLNDKMKLRNTRDWLVAGWLLNENKPKGLKERCKEVGLELEKFPFSEYFKYRASFIYAQDNVALEKPSKPKASIKKKDPVAYKDAINKWEKDLQAFKNWKKIAKPVTPKQELRFRELETHMLKYAYEDTLATSLLAVKYEKDLKEDPVIESVFYKYWNKFGAVLMRMERRGMAIDLKYLDKCRKICLRRIDECAKVVYQLARAPFNIDSQKDLPYILYDVMSLPILSRSKKTGKASTGADNLTLLSRIPKSRHVKFGMEGFEPKYPIAQAILDYRGYKKTWGTYIAPDSSLMSTLYRGKIFVAFNQCGTDTGRLSCSPNAQNISRPEDGEEFTLRKLFIPPRGYRYLIGDQSQVELRLIADKTGDRELIKVYHSPKPDIHQTTQDGCKVPDRTTAKSLNFGAFYGAYEVKFAHILTIKGKRYVSPEEAGDYLEKFFEFYQDVNPYKERLIKKAIKRGCFVRTYLGRKRRLPDLTSDVWKDRGHAERQAFNAEIQGGVADIMTICMIKADKDKMLKFWRVKMVSQVHDEVHFLVPVWAPFAKVAVRIKEIFEHPFKTPLKVPLVFSCPEAPGYNWAEAK